MQPSYLGHILNIHIFDLWLVNRAVSQTEAGWNNLEPWRGTQGPLPEGNGTPSYLFSKEKEWTKWVSGRVEWIRSFTFLLVSLFIAWRRWFQRCFRLSDLKKQHHDITASFLHIYQVPEYFNSRSGSQGQMTTSDQAKAFYVNIRMEQDGRGGKPVVGLNSWMLCPQLQRVWGNRGREWGGCEFFEDSITAKVTEAVRELRPRDSQALVRGIEASWTDIRINFKT